MTSFPGYSTDVVAVRVFRLLLRDFRAVQGQTFAAGAEHALDQSIAEFRRYDWPRVGDVDPLRFKMWMQLRQLFKRHIFTNDVYTADELTALTNESFVKAQEEFAVWKESSPRTFAVLQEARKIAKSILGRLDNDELASYVQIGRRATLGNPLHNAFLDQKVGCPKAFTCPSAAKVWFFKYLESDPVLKRAVRKVFREAKKSGKPLNLAADYLKLANVPKSWKILRSITPLSLIGLFLSYGIGGVVTERLRRRGLNIKKLQAKHRKLARRYSKTNCHATVDLRRASDSIMSHHLNAVLPREWYLAVRQTFIRQLSVEGYGANIYTMSVLPMGNGATFPIETLFFYCLIRAVGNLLKVKGTYSVYGDDLIYPSRIHGYVLRVFSELGIVINEDKSFVDSSFRESCGGDYYRGVDVRPALLPQSEMSHLKGLRYAAYLYKVANALRARWSDTEISCTLNWILTELSITQRVIYPVPLHYPSTSGWKTKDPVVQCSRALVSHAAIPWYQPWYVPKVKFLHGRIVINFRCIGQTAPEARTVVDEQVYMWDSLRAISKRRPLVIKAVDRIPKKPLGYWYFERWIATLPKREQPLGQHSIFIRSWIEVDKRGVKTRHVAEPGKVGGGFAVNSECLPIDFWVSGPQETPTR